MNLHAPQSVEAATELREIAAVGKQMISPKLSKPLVSVVQDTLVGVNRLTRPTEFFNRREFMNLLIHSKRWDGRMPPPAKVEPVPLWSGQQVVSCLLPSVYISMGNKMWDKTKGKSDPNYVQIANGQIQNGVLDGDIFDKALIHILYNDFSPEMTVDFLDSLQAVVATYLQNSGFSVGMSDIIADADTLSKIGGESETLKKRLESLQLQVHMGLFDNPTGRTNQEEFESRVFQTLNKAIEAAGKTGLKSLAATNRMVNMVKCGSKGSDLNIAQMIALLGQQSIEGKRIAYGFQDRTLPHFKRYDDGAAARGFIESSFVKGLSPTEFFFHAMTGREGLIDTAVKTADSGYMQRQLVKTMEDLLTWHDGSVRDAGNMVVQFSYGDDGTSATKIENQPISLAEMTDTEIRNRYSVEDVAADRSQAHIATIMEDRDILVRNVFGGKVGRTVQSAVHLPRLIANAVEQLKLDAAAPGFTPVSGAHVLDTIDRIRKQTKAENRLWGMLLRHHLNPRDLRALGFTRAAFDWLAEQIVIKHMRSWVVPGEMSGIIAAQSLGETTTQMSCQSNTTVVIQNLKDSTKMFKGTIGQFIDGQYATNPKAVLDIGHGSTLLDLPAEWAILGVSADEKTSWKPISQLSRHPANGGMVRIKTRTGRSTTATLSHSFLQRTAAGIAEIKGSDLRVGMRVPVGNRQPEAPNAITSYGGFALNRAFGWLCGIYLADGSFSGNTVVICNVHPVVEERIRALAVLYGWPISVRHYKGAHGPSKNTIIHSVELKTTLKALCSNGSNGSTDSSDKQLAAPIYAANKEFIAGLLSGYFDGDGNINAERQQIRVSSRSEELIRDIARLLPVCGIFGCINQEKSVRMPGDQVMWVLNLPRSRAADFQREIGFQLPEKAAALTKIVAYNDRADVSSYREDIDQIPALNEAIAETAKALKMPGYSRTYGRFERNSDLTVGRRTLAKYVAAFKEAASVSGSDALISKHMATLESALTANVFWDEIVALEYLEDPQELVYDFTVPGNDTFMVDDSVYVHNTLNTFHLSGVAAKSGMTRGVPRLKELLKATANPKATSLTIFLRSDLRGSKEEARRLSQELEFTMLKDLVTTTRIYYDPPSSTSVVAADQEWLSFFNEFEQMQEAEGSAAAGAGAGAGAGTEAEEPLKNPWIIRMELNREKMFNKNITMEDINYVLRSENPDIVLNYTDHNASQMVLRIRPPPSDSKASSSNALNDLTQIKFMQNKILMGTLVRGLPGLKSVSFRKLSGDDEQYARNPEADGKYDVVPQFVLDTLGTNFLDVMIHPDVDGTKLLSNHIHDIYENLGIEAARALLFREIFGLFEQQAPVNYRHVNILVDAMTSRGRMMSADRIGVNKKARIGPLAKASFEQTEYIMRRAAMFGEIDPITGVSANIMMGQPIRGGTTFTQILLDEAAFQKFMTTAPPARKKIERAPQLAQAEVDTLLESRDTPGCRLADLRIPAALPASSTEAPPDELPELEITLVDE